MNAHFASMAPESRLKVLARSILENTDTVERYCEQNQLATPSFDEHAVPDVEYNDAKVEAARVAAIDASEELRDLLVGPTMCLRPVVRAS